MPGTSCAGYREQFKGMEIRECQTQEQIDIEAIKDCLNRGAKIQGDIIDIIQMQHEAMKKQMDSIVMLGARLEALEAIIRLKDKWHE